MFSTLTGIIVGLIIAFPGTILPTKRFLRPRHEKIFYSLTLIPIAFIYVGFAYYYGDLSAVHAEIIGVIIFLVFALLGQFMATSILIYGYILHALWDFFHEIFVMGIDARVPWTQVPSGYAAFCVTYDLIIAVYIYKRRLIWASDGTV